MPGYLKVVAGTDFSESSKASLQQAARVAAWAGGALHVVHVLDTIVVVELEGALSAFQKGLRDSLVKDAQQHWHAFSKGLEGVDGRAVEVVIDSRTRGLVDAARRAKADLIVIGAFGSRPADVGMGSVATSCVRHAPCDVLVVRDTQGGAFRRVVCAVDFSPTALAALAQASIVAARDGAELHVVHAFEAPWHEIAMYGPTVLAQPEAQRQYRDGLKSRLESLGAGLNLDPAKTKFVLLDAPGHRDSLAEYGREVGADLLVLGTRGRTNLRDVLLGSTAERLLKKTRCSVLAVRPRE